MARTRQGQGWAAAAPKLWQLPAGIPPHLRTDRDTPGMSQWHTCVDIAPAMALVSVVSGKIEWEVRTVNKTQSATGIRWGQRVALHPATDAWMRGVRYGTVIKVMHSGAVRVQGDYGQTVTVPEWGIAEVVRSFYPWED